VVCIGRSASKLQKSEIQKTVGIMLTGMHGSAVHPGVTPRNYLVNKQNSVHVSELPVYVRDGKRFAFRVEAITSDVLEHPARIRE